MKLRKFGRLIVFWQLLACEGSFYRTDVCAASRGLTATAELLVLYCQLSTSRNIDLKLLQ